MTRPVVIESMNDYIYIYISYACGYIYMSIEYIYINIYICMCFFIYICLYVYNVYSQQSVRILIYLYECMNLYENIWNILYSCGFWEGAKLCTSQSRHAGPN